MDFLKSQMSGPNQGSICTVFTPLLSKASNVKGTKSKARLLLCCSQARRVSYLWY